VGFLIGELRLGEGEGQKPSGAPDVPGAGADVSDQVAKLKVSVIRSLEPQFLESIESILQPGYLISAQSSSPQEVFGIFVRHSLELNPES
jgi:hypothetical protein